MRAHHRIVAAALSAQADAPPATPTPPPAVVQEKSAPPPFDWGAVRVVVGVPCAGPIEPECVDSVMKLGSLLATLGARATFLYRKGFFVSDARNLLAGAVLEKSAALPRDSGSVADSTHLLMCDSDIEFPAELAVRMITLGVDIVGAPVRVKDFEREHYNLQPSKSTPVEKGALRVDAIGTGLMLVSRSALERVSAIATPYALGPIDNLRGLFDEIVVDGRKHLDDVAFCRRARDLGMEVWALSESRTVHHGGSNQGWLGDFGAWRRRARPATAHGVPLPPEVLESMRRELDAIAARGT